MYSCSQPPFRKAEPIDEGIEKMRGCDAVAGVCGGEHRPGFMMQENERLKEYLWMRSVLHGYSIRFYACGKRIGDSK